MKSGLVAFSADTTKTAGQTQDITGFGNGGTALKAVLCIGLGEAGGGLAAGHAILSLGAATPAAQALHYAFTEHAAGTSDCYKGVRDDAFAGDISTTGGDAGRLGWSTTITDGLRVSYGSQFSVARRFILVGYWDVTDVELVTATLPAATGSFDVTHTAGKTYEAGIALSCILGGTPPTAIVAGCNLSLGVFTASAQGLVSTGSSDNQVNAATARYAYSGEVVASPSTGGVTARVSFTSFSSGKITLNKLEGTAVPNVSYLLFGGNSVFKVGSIASRTDITGTATLALGAGTLRGGLLLSHGEAEDVQDTVRTHHKASVGAFSWDGTTLTQAAEAVRDENSPTTTAVASAYDGAKVYLNIQTGADALEGAGQITSVSGSDATFQMTDADPAAAFIPFLLWGDSGTPVSTTGAPAWESLAAPKATQTLSWESLKALAGAQGTAWEALGQALTARAVAWEATSSVAVVSQAVTVALEWLGHVVGARVAEWEARAQVAGLGAPALEWSASLVSARAVPWEALRAVSLAHGAAWEGLLGTGLTLAIPLEWKGSPQKAGRLAFLVRVYPALRGAGDVRPALAGTVEALAALRARLRTLS